MDINKYRVSLKFDEESKRHNKAVSILKQLGRKKSEFVTICIMDYLDNNDDFDIVELQKELGTAGYYNRKNKMENEEKYNESNIKTKTAKKRNNQYNKKNKNVDKENNNANNKNKDEEITEDEIPEIPTIDTFVNTDTETDNMNENDSKNKNTEQKENNEDELTEEEKQELLDSLKMFG